MKDKKKMTTALDSSLERIANSINHMTPGQVKHEILHFEGRFKLDFTEEYLNTLPPEKLRHILLAARLQLEQNH